MPDIPQTEAAVNPQVQPDATMPLAVTPDALGARVGDAIGVASEVSHKIYYDAQQRANQAATVDGLNQLDTHTESSLRDPKTGLLYQQTGKDAPAATQQAMQAFDEQASKIRDGLTNDQQKLAFDRMVVARRFDYQRTLDQYEHGQTEQYAKDVHDKAIAGTVNRAVNNAGDPQAVADALAEQKALLSDYGKGRMSQEAIDLQTQQHASATNLAAIEHLSSTGQDIAAKQAFDAAAPDMMAHDRLAAEKMVDASSTLGAAQRWTDANVLDKNGQMRSRADVDADVRKIADPKTRERTQEMVDQRFAQAEREHLDDQKQRVIAAIKAADASPQGLNDPAAQTAMAGLDPQYVDSVKARYAKDSNADPRPLIVQAARDPQGFLEAIDNDPALAAKYSKADLDTLLSKAQEIRRTGTIADAPGILSREQVINDALVNAGYVKTSSNGVATPDTYAPGAVKFRADLNQQVEADEKASGKKILPARVQEIADGLVIRAAMQDKRTTASLPDITYRLGKPTVDLAAMAETRPQDADAERAIIRSDANRAGVDTSKLTDEQMNRAAAQHILAYRYKAAGMRVEAQQALAAYTAILKENGKLGEKPKATEDDDSFWSRVGRGLSTGGSGY